VNTTKRILYSRKTDLLTTSNQIINKPQIIVAGKANDLNNISASLKIFSRKYFTNQRGYIKHYATFCRLMSPVNILKKGFAIVYHNDKIVADGNAIPNGSEIKIRFANTEITTTTKTKTQLDGDEFNL
jgi:exodeoxyribonuclease VII large subunit